MLFGTWLYARIRKEPLSRYLTFSLMSTSLGPLISSLLFANGFSPKSFLLALLVGALIACFVFKRLEREFADIL